METLYFILVGAHIVSSAVVLVSAAVILPAAYRGEAKITGPRPVPHALVSLPGAVVAMALTAMLLLFLPFPPEMRADTAEIGTRISLLVLVERFTPNEPYESDPPWRFYLVMAFALLSGVLCVYRGWWA
ncbi:MAG: hypothetical protein QM619_11620 [Micropruina sp.]|uniref:hypothetical protein n=1 Tax=Micropruina sp. TaxID=2737536 RepID=UPI0039E4197C